MPEVINGYLTSAGVARRFSKLCERPDIRPIVARALRPAARRVHTYKAIGGFVRFLDETGWDFGDTTFGLPENSTNLCWVSLPCYYQLSIYGNQFGDVMLQYKGSNRTVVLRISFDPTWR